MTDLLACVPGRLVALGASILDVHNSIKTDLTDAGWRVVSEQTTTQPYVLNVIPPAYEAIGNAQCREVVQFETGSNFIRMRPTVEALQAYPQSLYLRPKNAGALAAGFTLNGVSIDQAPATVKAGNSAADNLRFLYETVRDSTNPNFTDWDWVYQYPAPQNADDPDPILYGIRKTRAANVAVVPNANITGGTLGNYAPAGLQDPAISDPVPPYELTTDLVNGFIYFFQISKRGLALATRTNAGYFGPVHACYGEHSRAVATLPDSGIFNIFLSPVELVVGIDGDDKKLTSQGRTAKWIGLSPVLCTTLSKGTYKTPHGFTRHFSRDIWQDSATKIGESDNCERTFNLSASAIWYSTNTNFTDAYAGNDWQIHRIIMSGNCVKQDEYTYTSTANGTLCLPALDISDWYKFRGTATDENLQFVADSVSTTTLVTPLDAITGNTEITLADASKLPNTGMIVIENEAIEYTGKSGNTLTGCTRSKYATVRTRHFPGAAVYPGLWFIKINGGAIFCGSNKPS